MEFTHEGHRIESNSWPLADTGKFRVRVSVLYNRGDSITDYPFSLGEEFDTQEEAERFGVRFGIDVIDGKVPNCSVGP